VPLPEPIGKQREVVTLNHSGHTVVLGTAGSGKTTMAVHRAAYLSNPLTAHGGKTLLLSFNNSLLAYLNYLRPDELSDVEMLTYHSFAYRYLRSRGEMEYGQICPHDRLRQNYLRQALEQVQAATGKSAFLERPFQFFAAEERWIGQQGITSVEQYLAVDRVGRGDEGALQPAQRELMFKVYEAYRETRGAAGHLYDWDDVATAVEQSLASDPEERYYRHIVIDEGQDFSPTMLRSLAAAIPPNGSLTFFGDVAQQVYGRRVSWRHAGLAITAPWHFERNYRNSPQIAKVGLAIAAMPYFAEQPDMVLPTEFAAQGPSPTLVRCESREEEVNFVIAQAQAASAAASVAILVRRQEDETPFAAAFAATGRRLHKNMSNWSPDPGVSYGTIHNAKGYEFDTVILAGLSSERFPDPSAIADYGQAEAEASDGRLAYVAVTRARSALILLHTGTATTLLPKNDGLWAEVDASEVLPTS
jgi:superfamily I DNA/RNA helicase